MMMKMYLAIGIIIWHEGYNNNLDYSNLIKLVYNKVSLVVEKFLYKVKGVFFNGSIRISALNWSDSKRFSSLYLCI